MIYLIIYIKILFTIANVDFIKVIFNICFIKKIDKTLVFDDKLHTFVLQTLKSIS